jgi:hypothetical protein
VRPERFAVTLVALVFCACPAVIISPDSGAGGGSATGGGAGGGGGGESDAGFAKSAKGNLRFKGPERLNAEFAQALDVPPALVCNELGLYPCALAVHTLPLGGVDPYGSGLYDPPGVTTATTPMVVDRIALSACTVRVGLDLQDVSRAVLLKDLAFDAQGRLADPQSAAVKNVIASLYQRILLREPADTETAALVKLAVDINAKNEPRAGGDWVISACFVVLSSAESVFY